MGLDASTTSHQSNVIANELIASRDIEGLAKALFTLEGLDLFVADFLIRNGKEWELAAAISKFKEEDHPAIADLFLDMGGRGPLILQSHLKGFKNLDHVSIAKRLIAFGRGLQVISMFDGFDDCTAQVKAQIVDLLVEDGHADLIEELAPHLEGMHTKLVDCGTRGSGTPIKGYISTFTYLDTAEPNVPKLRSRTTLDIDAQCVNWSGAPEEALGAMRHNMRNSPIQWRGAKPSELAVWLPDCEAAANLLEQEVAAFSI